MRSGSPREQALLQALADVVGWAQVLTDPGDTAGYTTDWTRRYVGDCLCVVRPGSVEEVVGVVGACAAAGVAVVPQGGNTGLVGGAVPASGEVLVSTRRLTGIAIDPVASQVTVGAGVTLEELQGAVAAVGLRVPVDLGARGTATVGGMVATNAGGLSVLRFGSMRHHVVGVEVVLADGSVISHLSGVVKDNTGYDLASLLCGSEGTLGIVTAVRLALVVADVAQTTVAFGVDTPLQALAVLGVLRRRGVVLDAAEIVGHDGVALVAQHLHREPPSVLQRTYGLLVAVAVCDVAEDLSPQLEGALTEVSEALAGVEIAVAGAGAGSAREALWAWRERQTEAIAAVGIPVKLDVSVPAGAIGEFLGDIAARVDRCGSGLSTYVFGHLGDANLHVNVLGTEPGREGDDTIVERIEETVLRRVSELGGSISAEHGIGRMKARWLHLWRSSAEIAAMRAIKDALDPVSTFNPAVLFPRVTDGEATGTACPDPGPAPVR